MKFVLIGDDFPAVETLKLLQEFASAQIVLAFSSPQPERSAKVRSFAEAGQIPFYSSDLLKQPAGLALLGQQPFDWLININSTILIPVALLELPRLGALNMHPGLLPEYAGLHTHQWALRNGEKEFGSTIHFMEPGLDTGDVILQRRFPVGNSDTGLSLFYKCIREGTIGMRQIVQKIMAGEPLSRIPQDLTLYHLYRHRDALDGRIDWSWSAQQVERFVRAGNYIPLTSPTYTAHLDPLENEGTANCIEVLRVTPVSGVDMNLAPGTSLAGSAEKPPLVMCGDGQAVCLDQVRLRGETAMLAPGRLNQLLPGKICLRSRSDQE